MTTREIEFDPEKAALNLKEHKVSFEAAALVFVDPMRIERRDDSEENMSDEERWQTLGKVETVLFVVYTERGDKTRLISARVANRAEKRSYYGYDNDNRKGWAKAD
ncbi:BrnT family toxin [Breznakiellaceae bacterium SP9]